VNKIDFVRSKRQSNNKTCWEVKYICAGLRRRRRAGEAGRGHQNQPSVKEVLARAGQGGTDPDVAKKDKEGRKQNVKLLFGG